ncbi:MAG: aspartate carbamoyltransferase [Fusobacteriaceae bacterium]
MQSFISMNDFNKNQLLEILDFAKKLEDNPNSNLINNKIIASLFFEPSTRTRLSFTSAGYRIGGKLLGFDSPDATSVQKGESLRDTIIMNAAYSDLIIMRHPKDGSAKFASDFSHVPIINAGDGTNEHPSQTLLDLFTIKDELKSLENLKVAFIGDLKYGRTVHSLAKALSLFNCEFYFVANKNIQIPDYILKILKEKKLKYHILDNYKEIISEIDVMYMTRVQKERFENPEIYKKVKNDFIINKNSILGCKDSMIILHPLPRVNEINLDLDKTVNAKYFKQAANGVPIRMAMIALALDKIQLSQNNLKDFSESKNKEILISKNESILCVNERCITQTETTENKIIENNKEKFCYYCNRKI